jgi:catechol 2,3-dioxygenase-like lactoylglutathione lyase family enzyme
LLIDWDMAGEGRMFDIEVRNIEKARLFYRNVLGAREISREENSDGELIRLGLKIGPVAFAIVSRSQACSGQSSLAFLAAEFGTPFAAVILKVADPDEMVYRATGHGAKILATSESEEAAIISDPFGAHWAFIKEQSASTPIFSSERSPKTQRRN